MSDKPREAAILIRNATKIYGSRESGTVVFENLNMTVPRGCIYGLLGASGCGKTTLLSCIVGIKELNSGQLWVLGGKPGSIKSGVPGPRVGFMPQDISLISEFTVEGAVYYFGRLFEMPEKKMKERFEFLSKLLQLPPANRYIKNCSGGQQRRVSLAAALVHEPELLILDEPTVGIDPILRESIWDHLVDITTKNNVTVIITTHYIEETKQANYIGLMRRGTLIAEESPDTIIKLFNAETLEQAFLILSEYQNRSEPVPQLQNEEYQTGKKLRDAKFDAQLSDSVEDCTNININGSIDPIVHKESHLNSHINNYEKPKKKVKAYSSGRLKALLIKNGQQILRNPAGIWFSFVFPVLETFAFFYGVGSDPRDLQLSVVNEESSWENCLNYTQYNPVAQYIPENQTCQLTLISCRYLMMLNDSIAKKVFYDDLETALETVKVGEKTGVLYFARNFSDAIMMRLEEGRFAEDGDLEAGQLQFWIDMTDKNVGGILKKKVFDLYNDYVHSLLEDCQYLSKLIDIPVRFETPVYGSYNAEYIEFMYPAFLITLIFYLATSTTSTTIIVDRLEGVWYRSLVAGVAYGEILVTHFIAQFSLIMAQIAVMLLASLAFFDMKWVGSPALVLVLFIFQGVGGMLNGFLVSIICPTQFLANFLVTGSFIIMILTCGLIWPLEGMPGALRYVAYCLPFTMPIQTARDIIFKGWGLEYFEVDLGFIVSVIWFVLFSLLCFFILKRKG